MSCPGLGIILSHLAMETLADPPFVRDEAPMLLRIREAARATLAAWPEARAAVLFGSRARGDHRPDSDWDIAFITAAEGDDILAVPEGLPVDSLPDTVQRLTIPEALARRKAFAIGHVAHGIVRDGRLLAGVWRRPEPRDPRLQSDEYGQLVLNALTFAAQAAKHLSDIGRSSEWEADATACNHFAGNSADAAEHLAKAMLGRHGVDYERTHDVARLAEQAAQAGFPDLARSIGSMNGHSGPQHTAPYRGVSTDGCARAVARLSVFTGCLGEELDRAAAAPRAFRPRRPVEARRAFKGAGMPGDRGRVPHAGSRARRPRRRGCPDYRPHRSPSAPRGCFREPRSETPQPGSK